MSLNPGAHNSLKKMDNSSPTVIPRHSNTHLNTFGNKPDIYYPEFSLHMKHMGYVSPTMNNYMVSLKYEFRSKHWLYTSTLADISADIPVISNVESKLHQLMIRLMGVVKSIQPESKNSRTKYTATKTMIQELISSKAARMYLDLMYYNNTLNHNHCISSFNRHLSRNIWSRTLYTSLWM